MFQKKSATPVARPTDSELEILQILWQQGPMTVRAINDRLNERREVGYTTTLKLLQIMFDKGLVARRDDARTHLFVAAVEEVVVKSTLLRQFVDNTFRGSAMQLVMQALGNHDTTPAELDEIKALIQQLEHNQKS